NRYPPNVRSSFTQTAALLVNSSPVASCINSTESSHRTLRCWGGPKVYPPKLSFPVKAQYVASCLYDLVNSAITQLLIAPLLCSSTSHLKCPKYPTSPPYGQNVLSIGRNLQLIQQHNTGLPMNQSSRVQFQIALSPKIE